MARRRSVERVVYETLCQSVVERYFEHEEPVIARPPQLVDDDIEVCVTAQLACLLCGAQAITSALTSRKSVVLRPCVSEIRIQLGRADKLRYRLSRSSRSQQTDERRELCEDVCAHIPRVGELQSLLALLEVGFCR